MSRAFLVQNRIIGVSISKLEALTLKFPVLITTIAVLNRKIAVLTSTFPVLSLTIAVLNRRIAVLSLRDRETFQSDRAFSTFD